MLMNVYYYYYNYYSLVYLKITIILSSDGISSKIFQMFQKCFTNLSFSKRVLKIFFFFIIFIVLLKNYHLLKAFSKILGIFY